MKKCLRTEIRKTNPFPRNEREAEKFVDMESHSFSRKKKTRLFSHVEERLNGRNSEMMKHGIMRIHEILYSFVILMIYFKEMLLSTKCVLIDIMKIRKK